MLGSIIGAGVGLVGSILGDKSNKKAANKAAKAAEFSPYNTSNLFGSTQWDKASNTLTQSLSPWAQDISGALQAQASSALGGPWGNYGSLMQQQALSGLGGYVDAANAYGLPSDVFSQYMAGVQGIGSDPALANLFSMASTNPYALEQMGLGRDLLGSSYNDVATQRLDLLRQNAAPFEERATDSLMNRLFSQGRLGSTGGGRDIEAFSRGLAQADTSRQLDAQSFAEQLYGRDQTTGANLFSGGVANYLNGVNTAGTLGLNMGNQQLGVLQALLGGALDYNQLGYTRANDRIARAEGMFGFGETVGNTGTRNAANILGILSGITGEQTGLANLGITAGGNQAAAGAAGGQFTTAAAGSPFGGFLQGLGGTILQQSPWSSGRVNTGTAAANNMLAAQQITQPLPLLNFGG